jgi:FMN phosphatase YigB (HAD superfamily)
LLIIFDLDDTLIDTSGCITPFKMKAFLHRLEKTGLLRGSLGEAYDELLACNRWAHKSGDAISKFILDRGLDKVQAESALDELTAPLPSDFMIPTTPGAKEILLFFRTLCPIALVTGGHPPFQLEKLKKAGLDTCLFSKIHIPEDSIKKPYYQALAKEFSSVPQDVWVCGDRVQMDLRPAYELGMKTIHMRWGRGRIAQSEDWIDHSIATLGELKGMIK